jgi:hypothetical protein
MFMANTTERPDTKQVFLPVFTRESAALAFAAHRRAGERVRRLADFDSISAATWRPAQSDGDLEFRVIVDPGTEAVSENTILTRDEFLQGEFVGDA